jgi:hypothetical protein
VLEGIMSRKEISQNHFLVLNSFKRILPAFASIIVYLYGSLLAIPTTYAAGVPGGNISNPVVRAVDIA